MVGFCRIVNDDLFVDLLRKQIGDLTEILNDLEQGKPLKDYAHENLKNIEQQIRWLRKVRIEGRLSQF